MNAKIEDLIGDPLFQLNSLLWLVQPIPRDKSDIIPLLFYQGFSIYLIAPPLTLPLDLFAVAKEKKVSLQQVCRPDVILTHETMRSYVLTECKKSSFSPASSTSEQARSLLLCAGARAAEILGLTSDQVSASLLAYWVPQTEQEKLRPTLYQLQQGLFQHGFSSGNFSILSLVYTPKHVNLVLDQAGGEMFYLDPGEHHFIQLQPETDPRPIYFIPYDPDIGDDQSPEERTSCKRILYERIHGCVVAATGRCSPPVRLEMESSQLLNDAMFGVYDLWQNRDANKHMRRLCKDFMGSLMKEVNDSSPNTMIFTPRQSDRPGGKWTIEIRDEAHHEQVIDALTSFSCETLKLDKEPGADLLEIMEE